MKGRLFLVLTILVVATAACAGPDLVGGTDNGRESESVPENQTLDDASADEAAAADGPAASETNPAADSDASDPEAVDSDGSETQEPSDDTSPTLMTSTTVQKTTPTTSAAAPPPEGTVPPAVADSVFVVKAKADLADRLGVKVDAIVVVSVQEVDWPDRSIGCPQPDMVYAQVITNGTRIILSVDGVAYYYHSAGVGDPFYCENPVDPVPGSEA